MIASNSSNAEEIQHQMQCVRSSLREDVKELVENARDMTDWQYYVRRYPWAAVAVAAGVGFMITPGFPVTRRATGPTSAAHNSAAPTTPPKNDDSPSIVSYLASNAFNAASGALSRAAMNFLSQQLGVFLAEVSGPRTQVKDHGDQQHVEPHF